MKRLVLIALFALGLAGCAAPSNDAIRYIADTKPAPEQPAVSLPAVGSVVEPPALADAHATPVRASRGAPRTYGPVSGDVWGALANCESHGNPSAVGGGGRYFGAFQFSLSTWHSLGYSGSPSDYPYSTQLEAAQRLVGRSGWGQFPVCGRRVA